jgi:hypothetical protein
MDLSTFAPLVAAVWGLSEFLGRILNVDKARVALVAGPLLGAAGYWFGWITVTNPNIYAAWGEAVVGGFLATVIAGAAQDKLVKPVTKGTAK